MDLKTMGVSPGQFPPGYTPKFTDDGDLLWDTEAVESCYDQCPSDYPYALHDISSAYRSKMLQLSPAKPQSALVVGSMSPWIERFLLDRETPRVETADINRIEITDQRLKFRPMHELGSAEPYDLIISYSTVEHAGLGRYGDEIDPDGDLKLVGRLSKRLAKGGKLLIAVPVGIESQVCGNYHRIYDDIRLKCLFRGLVFYGSYKEGIFSRSLSDVAMSPCYQHDWQNQPVFILGHNH